MTEELSGSDRRASEHVTLLSQSLRVLATKADTSEALSEVCSRIDDFLGTQSRFCLDPSMPGGIDLRFKDEVLGKLLIDPAPTSEEDLHLLASVADAAAVRIRADINETVVEAERGSRRKAENRLERLTSSGVIGIVYISFDGQIKEANGAFLDMLGYTRDDLVSGRLRFDELTPESERHLNDKAIQELKDEGVCKAFEKHYIAKDGTPVPVMIVSVLLEGEDADALTLVQDLREQHRILDQLKLHSTLLDRMVEGVSLADEKGFIVYTNPAEDQIFGYEPGELVGCHVSIQNTYTSAENEKIVGGVIAHLQENGFWEGEFSNKKKDGTPFITRARISTVVISGAKHFLCVQEDITAAKEAEDAKDFLAKASELLASSLDYRTTLQNLADLAVPDFAEWCGVDSVTPNGELDRIAVAHADPEKVKWARMIHERYPTDMSSPQGVPNVLRTGVSEIYPDIPPELIEPMARDEEHLRIIREANIRSAMVVPLVSRGRVIAALTFVSGISGHFNCAKLQIAEDLARRAGLAVDNAMLYEETKQQLEERTELYQLLEQSESRARQLIDSMAQIAWVQGPKGENEYLNRRYYEFTGLQQEFNREVAWATVVHPEDMAAAKAHYQECFEGGLVWEQQLRLLDKSGCYRWHLSRLVPVKDEQGRITRWLGTSTDIHEQKVREMNALFLSQLSEDTRALSDPLEVMSVTAEKLGEYLNVDRCAYAEVEEDENHFVILGDFMAQGTDSIVGRYEMASFGADVLRLMRKGESYVVNDADTYGLSPGDLEAYRKTQIQAVVCCPVYKGGKFLACMAVHQRVPRTWTPDEVELLEMVTDRSWGTIERARANKRLQELNEELEIRVEERTAELREAYRNLEAFSYSVSHDLRTPLRNIATSSSLLAADHAEELNEDAKELVSEIGSSARRMSILITELLEHARLGSKPMQIAEVSVSKLAGEALLDLLTRNQTSSRDAVQIQEGMTTNADPTLLRLVLQNLIENALKFSRMREHPKVELGEASGTFFVRDNGIGFDPEYSHKVFEPFETLHSREQFAGTGIGLANARKIIERHGGKIWVESEPEKGTTFYFTLS